MSRITADLRVATWNVRAAIGPGEPFPPEWWRHVRRDRLEAMAAFIRDLEPDVIALEEVPMMNADGVGFDMAGELARLTDLEPRFAAVGHFPIRDRVRDADIGASLWGNAVLARLPIASSEAFGLPVAADDDLVEPPGTTDWTGAVSDVAGVRYADAPTGAREPRTLLRVTLLADDRPFHVLATHLTHVGSGQRRAQAGFVADVAARLAGPLVVAGDLNAPVDADDLVPLTATLDDAFTAVGVPVGDARRASLIRGDVGIDHLLLRGASVRSCSVDRRAGDLSDHWPVVA